MFFLALEVFMALARHKSLWPPQDRNPDSATIIDVTLSYNQIKDIQEFDHTKNGVKGFKDLGKTSIPKFFIQPPEILSTLNAPSQTNTSNIIPVINLENINSQTHRPKIFEQIQEVAREWGFFQVINHEIPISVMEETIQAFISFHEQPGEVKAKYYDRENGSYSSNIDVYHAKTATWHDYLKFWMAPEEQAVKVEDIPEILGTNIWLTRAWLIIGVDLDLIMGTSMLPSHFLWGWANESDTVIDDVAKGWAIVQAIPRKADVDVSFSIPNMEKAEPFDPSWTNAQDLCGLKGSKVQGGVGPFGLLILSSRGLEEYTPIFFKLSRTQNSPRTSEMDDNVPYFEDDVRKMQFLRRFGADDQGGTPWYLPPQEGTRRAAVPQHAALLGRQMPRRAALGGRYMHFFNIFINK
ncbi:hypothetical protein CCACVL1_11987 [Corchorus capsularis]|uniref:Non-haem dioxygenase N-terminal domain-containing protein n=1 Tax=Corchorus capsularis TaxID=210143 RepID=A0A1R3II92_COCAP|nr:hypothetical protein CCACVL1_11987 [Corchorus capsularis]